MQLQKTPTWSLMPRFKLTLEYDGAPFVGWQRQENGLSVQEALEAAVFAMTGERRVVAGAGRTDAGVHATGQVAHVDLARDWTPFRLSLFASSTDAGIDAVVRRERRSRSSTPPPASTLAYRGTGAYAAPQPVRALTVIPSHDQYVFAVKASTGLRTLEDIATRRLPLRIGLRGQRDHYLHVMLDHVLAAAGFTLADLTAWAAASGMPIPRRPDPTPSASPRW